MWIVTHWFIITGEVMCIMFNHVIILYILTSSPCCWGCMIVRMLVIKIRRG